MNLLWIPYIIFKNTDSDEAVTLDGELRTLVAVTHRRFRGIEWNGVKIYDLQKVTFSTLFKLHIAGLGVLIPKRYHMLG